MRLYTCKFPKTYCIKNIGSYPHDHSFVRYFRNREYTLIWSWLKSMIIPILKGYCGNEGQVTCPPLCSKSMNYGIRTSSPSVSPITRGLKVWLHLRHLGVCQNRRGSGCGVPNPRNQISQGGAQPYALLSLLRVIQVNTRVPEPLH